MSFAVSIRHAAVKTLLVCLVLQLPHGLINMDMHDMRIPAES